MAHRGPRAEGGSGSPQAGRQTCRRADGPPLPAHPAGASSSQPGQSWPDPTNPCVTHECEKHRDGLVVVTRKKACPPLNCPAVSSGDTRPRLARCGPTGGHGKIRLGWGRGGAVGPLQHPQGCPLPAWGTVHCRVTPCFRAGRSSAQAAPLSAQAQAQLSEDGCCLACPPPQPRNRECERLRGVVDPAHRGWGGGGGRGANQA